MSQFDDLLVVQEHDTAIDQLEHRRVTLPELAELAEVENQIASLEKRIAAVAAEGDEVARRQRRHEDELAALEAKIAEVSGRMYSGAVTIPRELQAMQADVDSMKRRQSTLEDEVLEAMTEREPLDGEVASLTATRDGHDQAGGKLRAAIAEAQAAIDAGLVEQTSSRASAAAAIPPDLLKLYEQLRTRLGGVGAARLVGPRCTGCHLTLPATEVDRIKRSPPDALIRCDQCSRILVR